MRLNSAIFRLLLIFGIACSFGLTTRGDTPKSATKESRKTLKYCHWEAFMLGIDSPAKFSSLKAAVKRQPIIALVTPSGVNREVLKGVLNSGHELEYITGSPQSCKNNHDNYQISEVLQIAKVLGFSIKVLVYQAETPQALAEAFKGAGQKADIVITYHSFWGNEYRKLAQSLIDNTKTLYIAPYAEIQSKPPTGTSFQGNASHPDGTGIANFITTIPLARNSQGVLLTPSCRDKKDSETINFIAPSSYASGPGETCPSVGVTAVTAAYIASTQINPIPATRMIKIMRDNLSLPDKRMLMLVNYNHKSVENLRSHLKRLTSPDKAGIRRLERPGVLDLWQIYCALNPKK